MEISKMKNTVSILLILLVGGLLLNSCKDEKTVTPSEEKNYFPSSNGSYWIYNRTYVENNEPKTTNDSTVIVGSETIHSQTASKYSMYFDGTFKESYFRYSNESKLYALPTELLPTELAQLIPPGILPDAWVVLADDKQSSWEMFSFNISELPIEVMGQNAKLNGVVTVKGTKGSTKNIDVSGTSVVAQEFTTTISYVGKLNLAGVDFNLTFNIDTQNYYSDNIGLVSSETLEQTILIDLGFTKYPYKIEESKRLLVRFNISQ
jgi:hypothetical protein